MKSFRDHFSTKVYGFEFVITQVMPIFYRVCQLYLAILSILTNLLSWNHVYIPKMREHHTSDITNMGVVTFPSVDPHIMVFDMIYERRRENKM